MSQEQSAHTAKLSVAELEQEFRKLTLLMYDTNVPLDVLKAEVHPHLAEGIEFIDPCIRASGLEKFKVGLYGFHCAFLFDFDIRQLDVTMNERGDGGRVMVDGTMNLRTLRFYSYPLRTFLVYDFVLTANEQRFAITRQEEMWSIGDMLQNAPVLGQFYAGFRFVSGYFFTAAFWLASAVATRVPWARHYSR